MHIAIDSGTNGTNYSLHDLALTARVHDANKQAEFFVLSDTNTNGTVNVRLFLHRQNLLNLREEIDHVLAQVLEQVQPPETGIKVEETCT